MLLDKKQVEYTEEKVDGDLAKRQEMAKLSGGQTVPQIFIGDTPIGGCDEMFALERQGKLDELLNAK
jgi:glutaredoxin 3|tara:strand:+ start:26144 stop:26344 length:201 start_codon:yes stop_codon:yes gene_type:complete